MHPPAPESNAGRNHETVELRYALPPTHQESNFFSTPLASLGFGVRELQL